MQCSEAVKQEALERVVEYLVCEEQQQNRRNWQ
jgi:hypothetical protein